MIRAVDDVPGGAQTAVQRLVRLFLLLPASVGVLALLGDLSVPVPDGNSEDGVYTPPPAAGWVGTAQVLRNGTEASQPATEGVQSAAGWLVLVTALTLAALVGVCVLLALGACRRDLRGPRVLAAAVPVLGLALGVQAALVLPFAAGQLSDRGDIAGGTVVLALVAAALAGVVTVVGYRLRHDV